VWMLLLTACATPAPGARHWPRDLTMGVAFVSVGATAMAVGGGVFGHALATEPSPPAGVDLAVFVPGVAVFGIGVPFAVVGAILTIVEVAKRSSQ
jgi:hypothetical protein